MDDPAKRGGIFREVRSFLAACAQYAMARLKLVSMEGKEAGGHVLKLLAYVLGALALLVFAWFFLCFAAVFLLAKAFGGENGWLWATLVMAGLHLIVAAVLALRAKAGLSTPLFPITTQEFKKDQEWLESTKKHN
jgi:uncharacterized membrane protein YqjE